MEQVSELERVVERLISTFNEHRLDDLERLYSAKRPNAASGIAGEGGRRRTS
jgi:hypothetical protein